MAQRGGVKIGSKGVLEGAKMCLVFRYRHVGSGPDEFRRRADTGLQLLTRIATELRAKGYEVSDSSEGKKSFGVTRVMCQFEINRFWIACYPPDSGDEWQVRWTHASEPSGKPLRTDWTFEAKLGATLAEVIPHLEGARDLRWISRQEAEEAYRQKEPMVPGSLFRR